MANNVKRIYIGAICNRDLEVLEKIKTLLFKNYNITLINLLKKDTYAFDLDYFKKKLKKYSISFLILKLTTHRSNKQIYDAINNYASNIPILNSIQSVKTCESRTDTFNLINQTCKHLKIPQTYHTKEEALEACNNGKEIIIKLDDHNIPKLPKNDRIIGIAHSKKEFIELINNQNDEALFLQEYLGNFEIIYKIYVIGRWVVSITSHNRLDLNENLSPLDLIHIRVPLNKDLKRRVKRLGRKFNMSIFGVDYILTDDGPYIIDVNDFPSFRSIPEGVSLISDHIYNLITLREQFIKISIGAKS
jgi:glutathione synthase/RimK-type ligase-like ATP-grasp enzyme